VWRAEVVAVGIALAAAGCEDRELVGSRFVKSVPITARMGGTITVTAAESPELAGTQLMISAAALSADVTITIALGTKPIAQFPAGPVVVLGTMPFDTAAQVVPPPSPPRPPAPSGAIRFMLPADNSRAGLIVEMRDEDGERATWAESQVMPTGNGTVFIAIRRLVSYQAGWRTP
jgi:hypothetical protein